MRELTCFQLFKELDLFGKEPDLYYKGKQRKTTWMGRICTWLYVFIYIFFFIYKLVRMFKRMDVSFSETNNSSGGLPKIHLDKNLFTYGLALSNDWGLPVKDETIYFPEAYLVGKRTVNGGVEPINVSIPFGECKLDDFGPNFQKFTEKMPFLDQYYCFKNFDIDFEGYSSAENFTSIIINIRKCVGQSPNGKPCKNETEINNGLNRKNLLFFSEDFDLTPYNYEKPVKEKLTINACPIRLDQFQTFVGYYQLVNIETENNLFGFETFSDIKVEKYIIYHSALIISYEMIKGQPIVMTYNIMLKENALTNQRSYTQLIDILGDVGGLMEVIESIFGVFCIFVTDILYDKTMVNNLFSFNLNTNMVKIKTKPKGWNTNNPNDSNSNTHSNKTLIFNNNNHNNGNDYNYNNNNNEDFFEKKTLEFSKKPPPKPIESNTNKTKLNLKKSIKHESAFNNNNSSDRTSSYIKKSTVKIPKKSFFKNNNPKNEVYKDNGFDLKELNININDVKIYDNEKQVTDKIFQQNRIIKKIDTNIFCTYFCFCCVRKRQNFGNALLDEAMGIITDKLDIFNMFRNFYYIDEMKAKTNYEYKEFEMSSECKDKLKDVSHKIYDSFYKL